MYRYVFYYRKRGKGDSCLFGAQMHLRYSRCSSPRWRKQGVLSVLVSLPLPTVAETSGAVGARFAPSPHGRGGTEMRPEVAGEVGPGPEPAPKPPPKSGPVSPLRKRPSPLPSPPTTDLPRAKGARGREGRAGTPRLTLTPLLTRSAPRDPSLDRGPWGYPHPTLTPYSFRKHPHPHPHPHPPKGPFFGQKGG